MRGSSKLCPIVFTVAIASWLKLYFTDWSLEVQGSMRICSHGNQHPSYSLLLLTMASYVTFWRPFTKTHRFGLQILCRVWDLTANSYKICYFHANLASDMLVQWYIVPEVNSNETVPTQQNFMITVSVCSLNHVTMLKCHIFSCRFFYLSYVLFVHFSSLDYTWT